MSAPTIDWTDATIDRLRAMWAGGSSLNQIAAALGVSRNAVAGKALRLGLERRHSPIERKATPKLMATITHMHDGGASLAAIARATGLSGGTIGQWLATVRTADVERVSPLQLAAGPGEGVGMADLRHGQCAWPLWPNRARPTFRCCGEKVEQGSYCQAHARRAYRTLQAPRPSKPWTQDDLDRCTGLYLAGMPVPKIAPLIGRSSEEIAAEMRERGIRFGGGQRLVGGVA